MLELRPLIYVLAPLLIGATADITRYRPPASPFDLLGSEAASALQFMQFSAAATTSYALNPLVWRHDDGTYEPVIGHQVTMDLAVCMGVFPLIDVGLVLPVALVQSGPSDNGLSIDSAKRSLNGAGVGDLRVVPRLSILQRRSFGVDLAIASELTFPTGDETRFIGDPSITWRPSMIASLPLATPVIPLRLTGALGYRVRKNTTTADVAFLDELSLHAGVDGDLVPFTLTALIEANLVTAATDPAGSGVTSAEILAGARLRVLPDFVTSVGVGFGLTDGVGTPDVRAIFGVAYAPLPPDSDGDSIADAADSCPNEPEDFDQFADIDGCPDTDNDGDEIPDKVDRCPDVPEDIEGVYDEDGCPENGIADADEDTIVDQEDKCPNEAEDVDEFEDDDGCPDRDNDRDGIQDWKDQCRAERETINGVNDEDGCPDEGSGLTEMENDRITIKGTVLFEIGSATMKQESKPMLDQVALQILAHVEIRRIRVEGHTDNVGADEKNLYLSQDRADSVRQYLISRGVAPERLEAVGYGETRPIDTNDTLRGRTRNRRVEFLILP